MHAGHERPAIVRAARDVGEPRAGRAGQLARRPRRWVRRRPAADRRSSRRRLPPRANASAMSGRRRRTTSCSSPGRHRMCSATSHSRVRRGCSTKIFAPRRAALRSRRCRIGTSCSASSPATRIDLGALDVVVRHRLLARGARRDELLGEPGTVVAPVVQVVRPEDRARELRQRVVVLVHQPPAGQERHALAGAPRRRSRVSTSPNDAGSRPRSRISGVVMPVRRVREAEREPALVAEPRVVDLEVVARELPHDLAAPHVELDVAAGAAMRAHGVDRSRGRTAARRTGTAWPSARPPGRSGSVFPLNGERKSSPGAIATCSAAPRSNSSMNRSPEIWSQNRVHRAHSTHRSRSRPTSGDSASGFGYVRFASM